MAMDLNDFDAAPGIQLDTDRAIGGPDASASN
jgi:hypothetical protein